MIIPVAHHVAEVGSVADDNKDTFLPREVLLAN